MRYDCHTHTEFSADGKQTGRGALRAAQRLGLGLVFTEHVDFNITGEPFFYFEPEEYWCAYERLRGQELRLGVELGLTPSLHDHSAKFLARVPFDQVIGSVHFLDGVDIWSPCCYQGRSQDKVFSRYFTAMAELIREYGDLIDVLGHIDYISRYARYKEPGITYGRWPELIDGVLTALIETDTVLELNTRLLHLTPRLKDLVTVHKRYRELGGRYITFGSDAHETQWIGADFALAEQLASECRLTPVTFRGRKMFRTSR